MKRIILLYTAVFLFAGVLAQNGAPLLSHYRENSEVENQSWAICRDDNGFMMFANRRGILTYDGSVYNLIRIPVIPYSLAYNSTRESVYVGGENDYGYLSRDEKGIYHYNSMSVNSGFSGLVSKIIFSDSTVFFYSEKSVSCHNLFTGELKYILKSKPGLPFTGMFSNSSNTFVNVYSKGLHRVEKDTLFPIVTGYMLNNAEVIFSLPYNKKLVLLGIDSLGLGGLSLFDGIKFYPYGLRDDGYLKENILSDGIVVNDSLYAFSTYDGGVLVSERFSGKLLLTVNYQNGLPDDEVFALGSDMSNGLWISHQFGLTRAELFLPIANFSIYPGLKGNLNASVWHKGQLYVATSEGVFRLSKVENYVDEVVFVRNDKYRMKPLIRKSSGINIKTASQVTDLPVQKSTKTNIFSRIFGKKNPVQTDSQQVSNAVSEAAGEDEILITPGYNEPEFITKVVKKLSSANYSFLKVAGLNEKCRQLIPAGDEILATTNQGLFSIKENIAVAVVEKRYVNYLSARSAEGRYYVAASDGYFILEKNNGKWNIDEPDPSFTGSLYSITKSSEGDLWAGSDNVAVKIKPGKDGRKPEYKTYSVTNDFPQRYMVNFINDTLFLFAESGIFYYNSRLDSLVGIRKYYYNGQTPQFVLSQPDIPWIRSGDYWQTLGSSSKISKWDISLLKVFEKINSISVADDGLWIIDGENRLYRILRNKITNIKPDLGLYLKSISNDSNMQFRLSEIVFGSSENSLNFEIVAPGYIKQKSIQYQHIVEKFQTEWSEWTTDTKIQLYLPPGNYILKVRARDIWGNISSEKIVPFSIKRPFTRTTLFYVTVVLFALVIFVLVVRFRERQLQKDKRILEEKVQARTAEIEAQKGEITSSIEYAGRIQMAMLPTDAHLSEIFPNNFVLFRPRDIVSGDFYWVGEDENHIFFTVADCTGHGVPGAFMSTLGMSTLNEIITYRKDIHANMVLNLLREKIKNSLHQTGKEGEAADGMDIAFCLLHKKNSVLEYSGAYNPLIIVQNGEMKEYKADRMPIGIYLGEKESFTNYEINIRKGDMIYLFTDGFTDQFGSEGGKFKKAVLKRLLSEIHTLPLPEQKKRLAGELDKWKAGAEQTDDITILGIRI